MNRTVNITKQEASPKQKKKKKGLFNKSNLVTVASNTYFSIRDIHTSPSDDCKNPDAISIVVSLREQS